MSIDRRTSWSSAEASWARARRTTWPPRGSSTSSCSSARIASATGSTGACAGGFRHQFSSRINIELSLASVPMILGFTEEHGLPLDVVQDGYLFLVRDEHDWADFRRRGGVAAIARCRHTAPDAR